jgi:hypothetical protein
MMSLAPLTAVLTDVRQNAVCGWMKFWCIIVAADALCICRSCCMSAEKKA